MTLAILKNGTWERWDGWLDEVQHNAHDVERYWSADELADAGLAVIQPAIIPPGKVPVGQPILVDDGGVPREVFALEDAPLQPLTSRQLRLGLVLNGISLSSVEAAIDAIEEVTDREVARIEWEYATTFERSHPLIEQVGSALDLTPEQIDDMWAAASAL